MKSCKQSASSRSSFPACGTSRNSCIPGAEELACRDRITLLSVLELAWLVPLPTCRPRGGGNAGSGLQENSALMGLSFQSHDDCVDLGDIKMAMMLITCLLWFVTGAEQGSWD